MNLSLSTPRMIELAAAVILVVGGIWLYRRNKAADQSYGSQGAVVLFVIAAIMAAHALGAMDYRPTQAEADYFKARGR